MSYTKLLTDQSVLLNLEVDDFDQVLRVLGERLVSVSASLANRAEEVVSALRAREELGSTASQGVAIPHIKLKDFSDIGIVIAVHKNGVDFRSLDDEPVHVFFSVVRPEESAEEHLGLLRWIADIAQHQDFVSFARQATTPAQIIDLLSELSPA